MLSRGSVSRYLNIRILLFRPILINLIQDSQAYPEHKCDRLHPTTLLEASLGVRCSVFCVQAAQEAITLIGDNLLSGAVPAWWYYIFCKSPACDLTLYADLGRSIYRSNSSLGREALSDTRG
jgi:hypothetical protein